jgi:outer membrane protein OmpA-like peptidoglycan-associated protein
MSIFLVLLMLATAVALGYAVLKVKLKPIVKIIAIVMMVGLFLFALRTAMGAGLLPTPGFVKALVPEKTKTFSGDIKQAASYELAAAPVAAPNGCQTLLVIPWNGASPVTVANGGARTTDDSLVKKYAGGCLNIQRQDDYGVMKDELVKFAQGVKNGEANPNGAAFVIIMGDATGSFIQSVSSRTDKLGQKLAAFGVVGFSYGEDKCMGPAGQPKGSVVAAVPYDGDEHICVKYASDNGIKINPDGKTYDPEAINLMPTSSFTEADDKFISSACEDRIVLKDGKPTSEKKRVCVNGVATWTPGDVAVAQQKGGAAVWASTRDYNQQMPATIIGNKEWLEKNKAYVVGLLKAFDRASFVIRSGDQGMAQLGKTQAAVFGTAGGDEAKPEFWTKYFVGVDAQDVTGVPIKLGGSRVIGLQEARDYFGLTPGSFNVGKGVFDTFCTYDKTLHPADVPSCPKFEDVYDTSFIQAALQGVATTAPTQTQFTEAKSITRSVSNKAYHIEFETGSARITPASMSTLNDIANSAGMTSLRIRIAGHTDDTGQAANNLGLSRQRAQAVADALTQLAPSTFPANRMQVQGFGSAQPVADNKTPAGRAQNRRVEITLGE